MVETKPQEDHPKSKSLDNPLYVIFKCRICQCVNAFFIEDEQGEQIRTTGVGLKPRPNFFCECDCHNGRRMGLMMRYL